MKFKFKSIIYILITLLFVATPLESIAIFEGFSLTKLVFLGIAVVWVLLGMKLPQSNSIRCYLLLLFYSLLTCVWSINMEVTLSAIVKFLIPSILLALIIEKYTENRKHLVLYGSGYVIGCLISVVFMLLGFETTLQNAEFAGEERMTALGQDQNVLAFLLSMGVVILLYYLSFFKKNKLSILYIILIALFSFAILSTGSRTGMVILVAVFGIYILSLKSLKAYLITAIVGVLGFTYLIAFIPDSVLSRLGETSQMVGQGDFTGRGYIWSNALRIFAEDHLFLGVGYSNFSEMLKANLGWQKASHNTYLTYLVEFGVVGVWVFIYILLALFNKTKLLSKQKRTVLMYNFIAPLFIVMLTLETEYKRWIFILIAILFSWVKINRSMIGTK